VKGNPVMRAKRVTGPTPNTVLCLMFNAERCSCGKPAVRTHTVPHQGTIVRKCIECIGPKQDVPEIEEASW
jgi:hypothetical protein